jgi:hypothetical protein
LLQEEFLHAVADRQSVERIASLVFGWDELEDRPE